MSIWTIKEKPPVLDKFCHLSLDAQKVMASLYRDFHQRKAEILSTGSNPSTGYQDSRYCNNSVSKRVDFGQYVERAIYSGHTDSVAEDKSTYSDSPPVETQDFRLLSQFCREENSPPSSPCMSVSEDRKQNSAQDVSNTHACVSSNYTDHTGDGRAKGFPLGSRDHQSRSLHNTHGSKQTVSYTDHTGDSRANSFPHGSRDCQSSSLHNTHGSKQTVSYTDHTGDSRANTSTLSSTHTVISNYLDHTGDGQANRSNLGPTECQPISTLGSRQTVSSNYTDDTGDSHLANRPTFGSSDRQASSLHRSSLGPTNTSSILSESTGVIDPNGKAPLVYEVRNFNTDSSRTMNEMHVENVNFELGISDLDSVIQGIHTDHDEPDVGYDASQALFSQDHDIVDTSGVVRYKKEASRKPNVTDSTRVPVNSSSNDDIKLHCEDLNTCLNDQNFIFKPVIIPFNSASENSRHLSENMLHVAADTHDLSKHKLHPSENAQMFNVGRNNDFERTHNGKRRKTESKFCTKTTGDMLCKSKVKENVSNHKKGDIREFIQVSYPDISYNRIDTHGVDKVDKRTKNNERSFVSDVISVASRHNADPINCYDESPYPLQDKHSSAWNIRKEDGKFKTGKKQDTKTSKFRVPVKSNKLNECSSVDGIIDISKLPIEVLREILATLLEAKEVVITLVYRNGSTQLRDCLFGSDKRKCLGKLKKQTDVDSIALQNGGRIYLFPMAITCQAVCETLRDFLHVLLEKCEVRKVGFQVKEILIALHKFLGTERSNVGLSWTILDAGIAAWLLDPDHPVSSLEQLVSGLGLPQQSPNESCIDALSEDMAILSTVMQQLFQELQRKDLWTLYLCLETPLVNVITCMQLRSLTVSTHTLLQFSTLLKRNLTRLDQRAHKAAGHAFVLNSHHQLRQVLFEELRLDTKLPGKTKLAKTSVTREMSTSEAVLTQLSPFHPLPEIVLEYRHLQKLKSAYVDGILSCVVDDHLVTHWDQTSAATGRLTSYQPNIQAIPKAPITISNCQENFIIGSDRPGEESIEIFARDAFVARSNYSFLAADFQQIELRLLGHLANDAVLLELFNNPQTPDIFNALTSQWLGKSIDGIKDTEREQTKRVVYSVMYGVGKEKLSQYLKCKPEDAKAIMNSFLLKFPAVSQFTKSCVEFCQQKGYTRSIFKRRRLFPHIRDRNPMLRAQAERQCVNFCVQGSAADICKAAMLQVQKTLAESKDLDASLIVQIHDELLLEVADADLNQVTALVKSVMENREKLCGSVVQLKVPIPVSISVGKTWGHMETLNGIHQCG